MTCEQCDLDRAEQLRPSQVRARRIEYSSPQSEVGHSERVEHGSVSGPRVARRAYAAVPVKLGWYKPKEWLSHSNVSSASSR